MKNIRKILIGAAIAVAAVIALIYLYFALTSGNH